MYVDAYIAGVGGMLAFTPSYVAVSHWFDKKKGKAMGFSTIGSLPVLLTRRKTIIKHFN